MLSLETAPSGHLSRDPRLKYFSAPLLCIEEQMNKKEVTTFSIFSDNQSAFGFSPVIDS